MSEDLLERLRAAVAPRYTVEREIARGGMGHVFLGRDRRLERPVAIKLVRPELATAELVERFRREARVLASLQHPHIVPVYDADVADGLFFYVMPALAGETLAARIERGPLPVHDAVRMARDVLYALAAAHRQGVVHRDVKPANIFLLDHGAMLADFGVAKSPTDSGALTTPGQLIGTPTYMAPEQLTGDAGPKTDVFAVGMVLHEAVTGRLWTPDERIEDAHLPRGVAAALRRALALAPSERWPDAESFARALWAPRFPLSGRGARVAAAALAGLVALALWWSRGRAPPPVFDLAIFPFAAEPGLDPSLGRNLARGAALSLQGFPDIRLVDPLTTFSCWDALRDRAMGEPDWRACGFPSTRWTVQGRVARHGDSLEVRLFVQRSARVVSAPVLYGAAAAHAALEDRIALELARAVDPRADTLSRETVWPPTRSPAALSAFFAGEEAFQQDDWFSAEQHYRRALALDPAFALAGWRLANSQRWRRVPVEIDLRELEARSRAALPPLVRRLLAAQLAPSGAPRLAAYDSALRYRPDPYAALLYGGELHSRGALSGVGWDSAARVLELAVRGDPRLAPAYSHLAWAQIRLGEAAGARRSLDALHRIASGPSVQEIGLSALLEIAYASRFAAGGSSPGEAAVPLDAIARAVRFGLTLDVPEAQRRFGAQLAAHTAFGDSVRGNGHEAQGLALVALGRVGEALAQFDSAARDFGSRRAALEAAEWRALLGPLGFPGGDTAASRRGRDGLAAELGNPRLRARAAWALGFADLAAGDTLAARRRAAALRAWSRTDSVARRLGRLLDASLAAARRQPDTALIVSASLLAFDSAGRAGDPFARAALHLRRGEWLMVLRRPADAAREWLWFENADVVDWPTGSAHAGDVDWALGTYARLLRARTGIGGRVCRDVRRAAELWSGADTPFRPLVREADSLARACRP